MRTLVTTVVGIAVAVALAAATPAAADPPAPVPGLPAGDRLIVTDCDSDYGQAYTASIDGAAVPLGQPLADDGASGCGRTGAVHPATGTVYWVSQSSTYHLLTLDLETGESQAVGELTGNLTEGSGPCGVSIDSTGVAYTSSTNDLYTVDLETAQMTRIGDTGHYNFCAWGVNPVDDKIYWFTRTGPSNSDVYTIDKQTGVATLHVSLDVSRLPGGYYPDGVVFDRTGIAWIQDDYIDVPFASSRLEPADLTTGIVYPPSGYFHDVVGALYPPLGPEEKRFFYTMGLIYVPAPDDESDTVDERGETLAVTGADATVAFGLGVAMITSVAAGVILTVRRRRWTAE